MIEARRRRVRAVIRVHFSATKAYSQIARIAAREPSPGP